MGTNGRGREPWADGERDEAPERPRATGLAAPATQRVLALQRTAGNRAVTQAILARQGAAPKTAPAPGQPPPSTRSAPHLRVRIVAHASPRWRSAKSDKEADSENQKLSLQRAQTVKAIVDGELRDTIGSDARIEYDVGYEPGREPEGGVDVSTEGHGSRDTLKEAKGNRQADEESQRRVDVFVERIDRTQEHTPRSTAAAKRTVKTRMWWINVDLNANASFVGSLGMLSMTLTNSETGRSAPVYVPNIGVGTPGLGVSMSVGGDPVSFWTDKPMGFSDFANVSVEYDSFSVGVVFAGYEWAYLSFPTLGPIAQNLDVSGWNVGAKIELGGGGSVGPLKFYGGTPPTDDYIEPPGVDFAPYEKRETGGDLHWAVFDTQKPTLSLDENKRLRAFVIDAGYRFRDDG